MNLFENLRSSTAASVNQERLYASVLATWKLASNRPPNVLDFGTGKLGIGRVLLQPLVQADKGELHLFDVEEQHISPVLSEYRHTRIVSADEVYGYGFGPTVKYDIVNLSYVLGTQPRNVAQKILEGIRDRHPRAMLTVIDYVMRNRSRITIDDLTSSTDAERRARKQEGDDHFVAMRSQHDPKSLVDLLHDAGYGNIHKASLLDGPQSKIGVVASAEAFALPTLRERAKENLDALTHKAMRRVRAMLAYAAGQCPKRISDPTLRTSIERTADEIKRRKQSIALECGDVDMGDDPSSDCLADREFTDLSCAMEERLLSAVGDVRKAKMPQTFYRLQIAQLMGV